MDLFCPHCTKRVSVPEDKAGQIMSCPLCTKQFQAPALAPAPSVPAPPAPPPSAATSESAFSPGEPPPKSSTSAAEPGTPPTPAEPGDFRRSLAVCLKASWLAFVPIVCLFIVFILSFFTWHQQTELTSAVSLWSLAFTSDHGKASFLAYTILMLFPTSILVIAAFAVTILPLPPQVGLVKGWLDLAVGFLLGITFLLLCVDYLQAHFVAVTNPMALAMKIAFRLHFLAMLASFGMFWLHLRSRWNLPAPRVEARW